MTAWISIEHAPKDRPVDLWVVSRDGGTRVPTCVWSVWPSEKAPERAGWFCNAGSFWVVAADRHATHYMEIPEGPK